MTAAIFALLLLPAAAIASPEPSRADAGARPPRRATLEVDLGLARFDFRFSRPDVAEGSRAYETQQHAIFGLSTAIALGGHFAVQAGVRYVPREGYIPSDPERFTLKVWEHRLALRYLPLRRRRARPYLSAGFILGAVLDARSEQFSGHDVSSEILGTTGEFTAGAGLAVGAFTIEAAYAWGLDDLMAPTPARGRLRTGTLSIGVGINLLR